MNVVKLTLAFPPSGNEWTFVSMSARKNSVNTFMGGVGMIVNPCARKSQNNIEKIQPRIMSALYNGNPYTTIISSYSRTHASETDIITFNNELSSLVRSIPKHNVLIMGVDMNVQIGKDETNKFYFRNSSNRYREYLTDFLLENRLTCLNNKF